MMIFLVIVSLYGGIERVPMNSEKACEVAAEKFNSGLKGRVARAFCINQNG